MHTEARWKQLTDRSDVGRYDAQPGREFLYRPNQFLVSPGHEDRVHDRLQRMGVGVEHRESTPNASRVHLADVDALELVARLWHDEGAEPGSRRAPSVGLNHVFVGEPIYAFRPADAPRPADPLPPAVVERHTVLPGAGVTVLVLDTGLADPTTAGSDRDPLDENPRDGLLDTDAGHGTFVADVVRRTAPGVELDVKRVLDGDGVVDEYTLVGALAGCQADIVNLSLGGFTAGDTPPIALAKAIASLDRRIAVVAAAGNESRGRPFWPAALKRVIGVAAVDHQGVPAPFTNHGWWVDACALGVDVHAAFVAGDERVAGELRRFDGWAEWSGTSFAAPQVTAAIAVWMWQHPGSTAAEAAFDLLQAGYPHDMVGDHGVRIGPRR
jgi:subtilisin family serine protease